MSGEAAKGRQQAMAFTLASLASSGLNYLFQVHAAAVLDARAFGLLSAWLALVTAFGTFVTFVQLLSLEKRIDDARWQRIARLAAGAALVVLVIHLAGGAAAPRWALGVGAVVGGIAAAALVGQLQARLALGAVACSLLATSLLRFGLPFAWPAVLRAPAFYLAHAASPYAGIVVIAFVLRPASTALSPNGSEQKEKVRLSRPLMLGFANAVFPYVDVLAVSATQDAATTGELSRIALVSRAIFYGGLAAFGVLFPHQLYAATRGQPMPSFAVLLERFLPAALVSAALPAAFLLDRLVLHTSGEPTTWLYASSMSGAAMVAILGEANRLAARGRLKAAAGSIAGVVLASAAGILLSSTAGTPSEQVTRYVAVTFCVDAVVLVAARLAH